MNAKELAERAGCYALELARRAGLTPEAWRQMVQRDTPLHTTRSPERLTRFIEALEEHIANMKALLRDLKRG